MENSIRNPQNCLSSRFCILSCHEFQVLWGWHSNHRGLQISHLETEINKPNRYSHDTSDRSNYPGGHDCILRGCVSHPNQWNWIRACIICCGLRLAIWKETSLCSAPASHWALSISLLWVPLIAGQATRRRHCSWMMIEVWNQHFHCKKMARNGHCRFFLSEVVRHTKHKTKKFCASTNFFCVRPTFCDHWICKMNPPCGKRTETNTKRTFWRLLVFQPTVSIFGRAPPSAWLLSFAVPVFSSLLGARLKCATSRSRTVPNFYTIFSGVYRAAESLCNQWQQDHGPFFKKILVGKSESSRILNILPKTPKKQLSLPITIFQRLCQFYGVYCNHHLPGFFVLLLTLTISHGHNIVPELIAISFEERKASTISRFVPKANE